MVTIEAEDILASRVFREGRPDEQQQSPSADRDG
jgi:hypothetical protein